MRQAFTRRLAPTTVFLVAAACTAPLAALAAVRNARRAMHVTPTTLVKLFALLATMLQPDRIIAWRVDPDTTALRPDPAAAHNAKLAMSVTLITPAKRSALLATSRRPALTSARRVQQVVHASRGGHNLHTHSQARRTHWHRPYQLHVVVQYAHYGTERFFSHVTMFTCRIRATSTPV